MGELFSRPEDATEEEGQLIERVRRDCKRENYRCKYRVIVTGVAGGGKKALLASLGTIEPITTRPVPSFSVDEIRLVHDGRQLHVSCIDIGGVDKCLTEAHDRALVAAYAKPGSTLLICVIDTSSEVWAGAAKQRGRGDETMRRGCMAYQRGELDRYFLRNEYVLAEGDALAGCPILFVANKQDLPGAATPAEVEVGMRLSELDRPWRVVPCVAKPGWPVAEQRGSNVMREGLTWLIGRAEAEAAMVSEREEAAGAPAADVAAEAKAASLGQETA